MTQQRAREGLREERAEGGSLQEGWGGSWGDGGRGIGVEGERWGDGEGLEGGGGEGSGGEEGEERRVGWATTVHFPLLDTPTLYTFLLFHSSKEKRQPFRKPFSSLITR